MSCNELVLNNVKKSFGRKQILKGITATLDSGVYGLLGSNGAGKTTLIRCIVNYYGYHGTITVNGNSVRKQSTGEIGYLPQKFCGYPELTVEQMMNFFCNIKKIPKKERQQQIDHCLHATNMEDKRNSRIRTLSGGMMRRLGIAQAILGEPGVILLDEPTSGLDPEERNRFKQVIDNISGNRIVILSTHIVEDIEACCDKTVVLDQGQIIYNGQTTGLRQYAEGRILELNKEEMALYDDIEVEKTYLRDDEKIYRVIAGKQLENSIIPTIEDGYLCLLKKK